MRTATGRSATDGDGGVDVRSMDDGIAGARCMLSKTETRTKTIKSSCVRMEFGRGDRPLSYLGSLVWQLQEN